MSEETPYQTPAESVTRFRRFYLRRWLIVWPIAWFLFCVTTSCQADNLRRTVSQSELLGSASLIAFGTLSSLLCLLFGLRGWWHLVMIGLYLFLLTEAVILLICILGALA